MFKCDETIILKDGIMEKKYGKSIFKKKDLQIDLDDGTRYFLDPENEVCLYKILYCPDGEGEEFYMH